MEIIVLIVVKSSGIGKRLLRNRRTTAYALSNSNVGFSLTALAETRRTHAADLRGTRIYANFIAFRGC